MGGEVMENVRATKDFTEVDGFDWDSIGAPESVTVRSVDELLQRLEKSEKSVSEGRTVPAEVMFERLRRKYGFSG
jgi:hypothetical protein